MIRQTKDVSQRKKIATEELQSWKNYVESRKGDLPQVGNFNFWRLLGNKSFL